LTNVNVNYAPSGFSAYEVPGETSPKVGRTGMPVSIIMQLTFMETEMVYKNSNLLRRPTGVAYSGSKDFERERELNNIRTRDANNPL
jgi:hypothetical protein